MAEQLEQATGASNEEAPSMAHLAGRYLTFHLANEIYGTEILRVREIIGVQDITRVPDTRPFLKGVINLRGQVIAVVDLRLKLGMEEVEYTEETCIIIVDVDGTMVGMIGDKVDEVVDLSADVIEPPPQFGQGTESSYVLGMGRAGERIIILLDADKALASGHEEGEES
jgi:purine-binding chemotaxis protein CheW